MTAGASTPAWARLKILASIAMHPCSAAQGARRVRPPAIYGRPCLGAAEDLGEHGRKIPFRKLVPAAPLLFLGGQRRLEFRQALRQLFELLAGAR